LMQSVERALDGVDLEQQARGYRTIASVQLGLDRTADALDNLEKALGKNPQAANRANALALKALCLHRLNHPEEARSALDEAGSVMKPILWEPLSEHEGFLDEAALYYLLLHREAQAVMGGK